MTIECWTVIHHVTEPIRRAAPIRHIVSRLVHTGKPVHTGPLMHALHPVQAALPHAHTWVEIVCRALPAAAVGGGLLIPHPVDRLPVPPVPPPAITAPQPTFTQPPSFFVPIPFPRSVRFAPPVSPTADKPAPPRSVVAEPSSIALLLSSLAGLALVPAMRQWRRQQRHGDRRSLPEADAPGMPMSKR